MLINKAFSQMHTQSWICRPAEMDWASDHAMLGITIMDMPLIRAEMRNVYQRSIFKLDGLVGRKDDLQRELTDLFEQAKHKKDGMAWVSDKITVWMEMNLSRTGQYRTLEASFRKIQGYKETKKVKERVAEVLRQGKGKEWDNIVQILVGQIQAKDRQEREGFEETVGRWWLEQGKEMQQEEERWMLSCYRRALMRKLSRLEDAEIKKKREMFKEKCKWGRWYMPWASYYWKLGKKAHRPDLGIIALRNEEGRVCTHDEKDAVIENYMRKMWAERDSGIEPLDQGLQWQKVRLEESERILNKPIAKEEVAWAIAKLKNNKAPGCDMIPNEVWKGWSEANISSLTREFEKCRLNNVFPKTWKETDIRWLFKKGDPLEIANYRPIALGNTLYKLYMRVLANRLDELVETTGIVSDEQQGFRTDRSCAAAIIMMKTIIARRMSQKSPFYMACLDISKAYDTVDYQRLWQICESMGITGRWLDNVKELYSDTFIRAIGTEGMLERIKTVKGIKQGCPMSPLLFALYVQTISTALKGILEEKDDEPNMLLYADDMVLWADSEKELKIKMNKVLDTMNTLGLRINGVKTELQHNKWRVPSLEGQSLKVGAGMNESTMKYLNMERPIRYLGAWTTANNDTTHGLEMLREKLQSRLDDIQMAPASALTKALLAKGRLVSVWHYTASVQDINWEFANEWDTRIYRAITSREFGAVSRKDLVYEPVKRGGMGMQSLVDLYKINRCRILAQVMEAAKRQRGRGQTPWVEK